MATVVWNAAVSGDFADGANWSTGLVPGSRDLAEIEAAGSYTVTSSADETVLELKLANGAALSLTGGIFSAGPHKNADELSVDALSTISVGFGAKLRLGATSGLGSTTIALTGSIDVAAGGVLAFSATGDEGEDVPAYAAQVSGGTVNLATGSTMFVNCALYEGGVVQGSGTITSEFGYDMGLVAVALNADNAASSLTVVLGGGQAFQPSMEVGDTAEATDGAQLAFEAYSGTPMQFSSLGVTEAIGAGSRVTFDDVYVQTPMGGSLASSDGGVVEVTTGGASFGYSFASPGFPPVEGVNNTGSVVVDGGAILGLAGTFTNSGTVSLAPSGGAASILLKTQADFDEGFKDTLATRYVTLEGDGSIVLSDNVGNVISAARTTDILANNGNTISGAGQIGDGGRMTLNNAGVIDATGTNALVVDVATGKVTDQVHGTLEASGSGGLSLTGGTFNIIGTVEALDGSAVTFGSGAVLLNDAAGVLTGGTWEATDTGDGAGITLAGAAVTTLAAKVVLTGAGSTFKNGGEFLDDSLATIAAKGKLELLADRNWNGDTAVVDDGLLQLGGGAFNASGLTVASGGTLTGFGSVNEAVTNNGLAQAYQGSLDLTGDVNGAGTLKIWGSSTLTVGGTIAATEGVLFNTGVHADLRLGDPSSFASTITNWALGDTIDLMGTNVATAQITGDTLAISIQGGGSLDYSLANPPTGVRIVLASDGDGGTNITLFKATSAALLSQGMAAMAGADGSRTEPSALLTHRPDSLMALARHA